MRGKFKILQKKITTGTIGDVGVISFNANKNYLWWGGILLLKKKIADRLIIYHQAKNNLLILYNEVGYNYRMINIAAALDYHNLILEYFLEKKIIRHKYLKEISKQKILN